MENPMRDLVLQSSGVLAMAAAAIHGVLGETYVFARARIEPPPLRRLLRLVWQCSTVAWIGSGAMLLVASGLPPGGMRQWIVILVAAVFGFGASANAWATRGRHFGWVVLGLVVILALLSLWPGTIVP
jgi:hypothetical protein